ncbi:TetR/AcrR family transcriptional regulator [Cohnella lubricantis]|uniref:TetR/AcrR family transcriptional regulator n=1 Tax=Cohnella lubricantis TaxID=2163172 RepID=A0A841TEY6_9BACL|nr:TetR/AcrR family transcriptional regulator [Cohnella lubricantis]MBB6677031.1 TetR/AcrR family transcriptional regulator [Cohnella lubricantis]MBP2119299.1 AcrR family transcriptional regulator [Cohnella lubricantis]
MSPLNKQQLERIRDERTAQIKQAALQIFARHGFARTKTSMIAAAAGISEGLIFRYFQSKDALYTMIVHELLEDAASEIDDSRQLPGTPYEQIKALTQNMLDDNNKYAFMLILKARKTDEVPAEVKQILEEYSPNTMINQLMPIFVQGQEIGEFSAGDPRQLLCWYISVINSLILQEQGEEEYGFPDVDVMMRMLTK